MLRKEFSLPYADRGKAVIVFLSERCLSVPYKVNFTHALKKSYPDCGFLPVILCKSYYAVSGDVKKKRASVRFS